MNNIGHSDIGRDPSFLINDTTLFPIESKPLSQRQEPRVHLRVHQISVNLSFVETHYSCQGVLRICNVHRECLRVTSNHGHGWDQ